MDIINLNHKERSYQEILQQAVALIESARNKVARAVIINSNEMHWEDEFLSLIT